MKPSIIINNSEFFFDPTTECTNTNDRVYVYGDTSKLNTELKLEERQIC
jgi:hypothetical protein